MTAAELAKIADEANRPYTLEYVLDFCKDVAERGGYSARFNTGRFGTGLTAELESPPRGFSVAVEGDRVVVAWAHLMEATNA